MGQYIHFCNPYYHLTLLHVFEYCSLNKCISAENEITAAAAAAKKEKVIWGMEAVIEM